jgi:hypothetical protein
LCEIFSASISTAIFMSFFIGTFAVKRSENGSAALEFLN